MMVSKDQLLDDLCEKIIDSINEKYSKKKIITLEQHSLK